MQHERILISEYICYNTSPKYTIMQYAVYTIITVLLISLLVLVYLLYKKLEEQATPKQDDQQLFLLLQQQLQSLGQTVDANLKDTHSVMRESQQQMSQALQRQFSQSTRIITDITEKLTSLDKTNQQVISFSEQLSNLEKVLKSQKQRGNLGEAGLQLVLENMLPPTAFALQYGFSDGDTVDAIIFTKDGSIPVDAKFSLENYQRLIDETDESTRSSLEREFKNDLKKRIDETSKYIKPKEGTLDFAFMFIPSEAIYYDLLVNEVGAVKVNTRSLVDYAFNEKKVIIVSPTTFAAYLQTVLQGLRALQIEEGAKEIRKNVAKLEKHIGAYKSFMDKLGAAMSTSVNHYNAAYKELGKIDTDVTKITAGERQIDPLAIDKPAKKE